MSVPESESDLVIHLTSGDKFLTLISKAGGLLARKQFQEWLETCLNLALQEELFNGMRLIQERAKLQEQLDVERKTKETSSGAPEVTAGNSQPQESTAGSGSKVAELLKNKQSKPAEGKPK